jgi:hypothetical protein
MSCRKLFAIVSLSFSAALLTCIAACGSSKSAGKAADDAQPSHAHADAGEPAGDAGGSHGSDGGKPSSSHGGGGSGGAHAPSHACATCDAGTASDAGHHAPAGHHGNPDAGNDSDAGRDDAGVLAPVVTMSAANSGSVFGFILDPDGNPISGANISASGTSSHATTGPRGSYALGGLPLGFVTLSVTVTNYVARTVASAATPSGFEQNIVLGPSPTATIVKSSGTVVTAGAASLSFPAGAYASSVQVGATWLTGGGITTTAAPPFFVDDQGNYAEVLGILHVTVPSEPAQNVTVTVPVASNLTASDIALFSIDAQTNTWSNPIAPSSVSGGVATFVVSHFSDEALAQLRVGDAELAYSVSGSGATYTLGNAAAVPISAGMLIPRGVILDLAGQSVCSTGIICGTSDNRCEGNAVYGTYDICRKNGKVQLNRVSGVATQLQVGAIETLTRIIERPETKPPAGQRNKYTIRTRTRTVGGVRGTVTNFDIYPCSDEPSADYTDVDVAEGDVLLSGPAGDLDVTAGQDAEGCEDCTNERDSCKSPFPAGSFIASCIGCVATSTELECAGCYDTMGMTHLASLPLPCSQSITNCLGQLVCGDCNECIALSACCPYMPAASQTTCLSTVAAGTSGACSLMLGSPWCK